MNRAEQLAIDKKLGIKPTQRTPGEWVAKKETAYVPAQVWTDDGRQIAEVYGEDRASATGNALLMSKAPALAKALNEAPEMDCWPDMTRDELEQSLEGYVRWFRETQPLLAEIGGVL